MKNAFFCLAIWLGCLPSLFSCVAAELVPKVERMLPMLFASEQGILQYDATGLVVWRADSGVSRDVWRLPNGNVLFPCNFTPGVAGGVREVNPQGKVVWEYKTNGWVLSCQRLKDGNTLVAASGRSELLVVSPQGVELKKITVRSKPHKHSITMARQIDNGNFLIVEENPKMVAEYTADGKVVWEMKTPFTPFSVIRMPGGTTLISGQDGIVEVNPAKEIVWRLGKADVADMGPRWFAGLQVMDNGDILVCNAGGKVPFFSVNRAKQITWRSPAKLTVEKGHGVFLLDNHGATLR